MPELPEVETTRRGLLPHLQNQTINNVIVRNAKLRWPVTKKLSTLLIGQTIINIERRGKYLIFETGIGNMLVHLGMSGSLRITEADGLRKKHDHIDWVFNNNKILRFHDPRRFGSVHWTKTDPLEHPLLVKLGPEPLNREFNGTHLFTLSRKRTVAIKNFIMNSQVVVGVGNIYASESLFLAGIRPSRAAGKVSKTDYEKLAKTIKQVLRASIKQGGTTLRDFVNEAGNPGYFRQKLRVYERAGQACINCASPIQQKVIGQRASYYCSHCQK